MAAVFRRPSLPSFRTPVRVPGNDFYHTTRACFLSVFCRSMSWFITIVTNYFCKYAIISTAKTRKRRKDGRNILFRKRASPLPEMEPAFAGGGASLCRRWHPASHSIKPGFARRIFQSSCRKSPASPLQTPMFSASNFHSFRRCYPKMGGWGGGGPLSWVLLRRRRSRMALPVSGAEGCNLLIHNHPAAAFHPRQIADCIKICNKKMKTALPVIRNFAADFGVVHLEFLYKYLFI